MNERLKPGDLLATHYHYQCPKGDKCRCPSGPTLLGVFIRSSRGQFGVLYFLDEDGDEDWTYSTELVEEVSRVDECLG